MVWIRGFLSIRMLSRWFLAMDVEHGVLPVQADLC